MSAVLGVKPTFGGHEKFVFRQSWLKKGVDALHASSTVFAGDEALVTLGVGKNMVRSIRFWCLATGVAKEGEAVGRQRPLERTRFGRRLLDDGGWDPYLEDPGSLWLIHWQLAANTDRALVWHIAFGDYYETEFSKARLAHFVAQQLARVERKPGFNARFFNAQGDLLDQFCGARVQRAAFFVQKERNRHAPIALA